jgi:hypothetical protein
MTGVELGAGAHNYNPHNSGSRSGGSWFGASQGKSYARLYFKKQNTQKNTAVVMLNPIRSYNF